MLPCKPWPHNAADEQVQCAAVSDIRIYSRNYIFIYQRPTGAVQISSADPKNVPFLSHSSQTEEEHAAALEDKQLKRLWCSLR